jgi:hypothetical protein
LLMHILNLLLLFWNQHTITWYIRQVPRGRHRSYSIQLPGNGLPRCTFTSPLRAFFWSVTK